MIALVIGLVVTLIAALVPAVRATRVPPLAALRDVAIDRSGASKARIALGIVVLLAGGLLPVRGLDAATATPTPSRPSASAPC